MEKAFILSLFITGVFFVSKLIDMKYISKEWKPMKTVMVLWMEHQCRL